MLGKLLQPEINEIIAIRDFASLKSIITEWTPPEIAEVIEDVELEDRAIIFRLLPQHLSTSVFEYLELESQEQLLRSLGQTEVEAIINDMAADDRTMLFEDLPGPITKQLITLLSPQERLTALKLLGYPESSIGRLMTPEYIAVHEDWTVQQVLDFIRKNGDEQENLQLVYVIDYRGRLIDDIKINRFLITSLEGKVEDLMDSTFVSLHANDDQETAIEVFRKYDREALPVVDGEGHLLGVVTVDDVLDVVEEEATEDIQKIGGTSALDEPYMETPFFKLIQKRAGWLIVLFLGEMFTATAMAYFEDELARAIVLATFIPLIISSGGNSGSQASTLVIRAMALGEITIKDWWRVVRREFFSGLTLGLILGIIGFFRIELWSTFSPIYGEHATLIGITVAITLTGIVLWGTLTGSILPLLLKRFGFDPATSSAPFVATLVDVTGLVIYFGAASVILSGTLL
jgi:magnesium transporter